MVKIPVFIGEYRHNMDKKGRLAVPAAFRELLGKKFYGLVGLDHCVTIYTEKQFAKLYEKLESYPDTKKNSRALMQQLMGSAGILEPDAQGRVLIPANLIKYAGLTKECAVIGVGNHVEIWDSTAWDKKSEETLANLSDIAENLPEIQ